LFTAIIAVQQNDIKRILAYSTLSQLGYMVMGVGLQGQTAAMFHLTTHAFFKALLFLGAGSVIIALHHEQDIWNMGALRKKLPVTFWTFAAGTLALAGIWPLSGFFSKDGVLGQAWQYPNHLLGYTLFAVGALVAALTAFYMTRLVVVVFFGTEKSEIAGHAHESPPVMLWPLRLLALFSIIGGLIGVEEIYRQQFRPADADATASFWGRLILPFAHTPWAAALGLLAAGIGIYAAYALYARTATDPLPERLGALSRAMRNRFYLDELYEATVIKWHDLIAGVADLFDRWFIAGAAVRGVHGTTEFLGRALRLLQTGSLQTYAFLFALGVALVLYLALK
jgi:NADH-quinone oxidoreductase subunit L